MKLGIVGSGNVGLAVTRLARGAGIQVVLSNSRGPDSLRENVSEFGVGVEAATVEVAAFTSQIVLVAIPFWRHAELAPTTFANSIVIDAMNFDPSRDGAVADSLADGGLTPAEHLQRRLPSARIVKAFSSVFARHIELLARPQGAKERSALPIAGDDLLAKASVTELISILGWDVVDAGALAESKEFDLGTPAFVVPYVADPKGDWPMRLPPDPGQQVGRDKIRTLLDQA